MLTYSKLSKEQIYLGIYGHKMLLANLKKNPFVKTNIFIADSKRVYKFVW